MTVKQLIEQLSKYDPNSEIKINISSWILGDDYQMIENFQIEDISKYKDGVEILIG